MSRRRNRRPHTDGWVPARLWTAVFTWSPVLSLFGAGAGGVLLTRLLLISSSSEYHFGPDMPIEAACLVMWGAGVVVLMNPPRSVLALEDELPRPQGQVWSLGRRFRIWNVLATPVLGLLLVLLLAPLAEATSEQGLAPGSPSAVLLIPFTAGFFLVAVFTARITLWGVELREDTLIARGFLRTRRYRREEVEAVRRGRVSGVGGWALGVLMNSQGDFHALHVRLRNGRTKVLYASHSSQRDVVHAAQTVTAWLTRAEAVFPIPRSSGERGNSEC